MEQDLFISPSTKTTEAPSETIYSSLLLQLNMPQAFSVGQIQLINNRVTGSSSMSYLEKAVSHLPHQGEKGPKTTSLLCLCSFPSNTGLNFGGQMQLPYNCWLPGCCKWAQKNQETLSAPSRKEE